MEARTFQMTRHALSRLEERTRLDAKEIEAIFQGNFFVKVGACRKPGKHHLVHRMFFSPVDGAFFVAIQDLVDGEVITVLTLEQYKNHYAITSMRTALREVNRMVLEGFAPSSCWQKRSKGERVMVYADFGTNIRQASLGAFRTAVTGPQLDQLGNLPKFWGWVAKRCQALQLPLDCIHTVTARLPYGDAQEIHFLCA